MGKFSVATFCNTDEADLSCQLAVDEGDELDREDSELVKDSEVPVPEAPKISAARELMNDDENENETDPDIFQIVKLSLKDIKGLDMPPPRRLKMVMQLTAITQYVQLWERFC
jgi:hypothetical protein